MRRILLPISTKSMFPPSVYTNLHRISSNTKNISSLSSSLSSLSSLSSSSKFPSHGSTSSSSSSGTVAHQRFSFASFSSAKSESEKVHGELRENEVRSKAMRKKLASSASSNPKQPMVLPPQVDETQPTTSFFSSSSITPSSSASSNPNNYSQETFGQMWIRNMTSGFSVALGVMVVLVLLRSIGLDGEEFNSTNFNINDSSSLLPPIASSKYSFYSEHSHKALVPSNKQTNASC